MSWDADLIAVDLDGHTHHVRDWNYTHNCNGMANDVLRRFRPGLLQQGARAWWARRDRADIVARIDAGEDIGSWWDVLDEMNAKESLPILDLIIGAMMETPEYFREMNPANGWGDFDSFLAVLREMRETAADYPSAIWRTSG